MPERDYLTHQSIYIFLYVIIIQESIECPSDLFHHWLLCLAVQDGKENVTTNKCTLSVCHVEPGALCCRSSSGCVCIVELPCPVWWQGLEGQLSAHPGTPVSGRCNGVFVFGVRVQPGWASKPGSPAHPWVPRSDVGACTEDESLRKATGIPRGYQSPPTQTFCLCSCHWQWNTGLQTSLGGKCRIEYRSVT